MISTGGILLCAWLGSMGVGILAFGCARQWLSRVPLDFPISFRFTPRRILGTIFALGAAAAVFFTGVMALLGGLRLILAAWIGLRFYPWIREKISAGKKTEKLKDMFPQTVGMAIQALKAGQTLPQVLEYLSRESHSPLREEWARVCAEMNLGASCEQALGQMEVRYPDFADFRQFFQSYKISAQTGANLTHLLEVLLEGMEERNRLLRKMDAMTAQARLSGLLMGLLPFILGFVFFIMDPGLLAPLVTEKIGWGILLLSVFMETIGFLWIRQLLRIEV